MFYLIFVFSSLIYRFVDFSWQGILPYSAYSGIKELFVPEEKLEEAKQEAEEMPSIEISTVGLEFFFFVFCF